MKTKLLSVLTAIASTIAVAETIVVPSGDTNALHLAFLNAKSGDTIEIEEGIYDISGIIMNSSDKSHLTITGKNGVTVKGVDGSSRENIILRGAGGTNNVARGLSVASNSAAGTNIISGITIENCGFVNGSKDFGGVYLGAYSQLTNCVVRGNMAKTAAGVGLAGTARVYNSLIAYNVATNYTYGWGGGASGGVFYDSVILCNTNTGNSAGAGVSSATLYRCLVAGNYGSNRDGGGGLAGVNTYDCIVSNNYCVTQGGGAFEGTHRNTLFIHNTSKANGGAVSSNKPAKCYIYDCTFIENYTQSGNGGAVRASTVTNSYFEGNRVLGGSYNGGGAVSDSLVYNSVFRNNSSAVRGGTSMGGSLYNCYIGGSSGSNQGSITFGSYFKDCVVVNCTNLTKQAFGEGGTCENTLFAFNQSKGNFSTFFGFTTLKNCIFYANTNSYGSGSVGILRSYSGGRLINCTLIDNVVASSAGGTLDGSKNLAVVNTIMQNNTAGGTLTDIVHYNSKGLYVTNCIWNAGSAREAYSSYNNVITNKLRFSGSTDYSLGNLTNSLTSPFQIHSRSIARDAGTNAVINLETPGTAIGGTPRIIRDIVDIGAFEYDPGPKMRARTKVMLR